MQHAGAYHQDDTSLLFPAETTAADTLSAWPRRYRQSGRHVYTVTARLLQRAAGSTSTVHHSAIAVGHECSSATRLQPPVTTPALTELHWWLPITARVQYKLCLLVHSAVVGTAPDYLKNMLQPVSERASQRALRSATNNDMAVPRCQLKLGEHAFSIAAPRAWNNIPADLHATLNTATFKKNLKTFLFRESYSTS